MFCAGVAGKGFNFAASEASWMGGSPSEYISQHTSLSPDVLPFESTNLNPVKGANPVPYQVYKEFLMVIC
jgi:hypothetical protein